MSPTLLADAVIHLKWD